MTPILGMGHASVCGCFEPNETVKTPHEHDFLAFVVSDVDAASVLHSMENAVRGVLERPRITLERIAVGGLDAVTARNAGGPNRAVEHLHG
jgi:hypothetical protein